MCFQVSFGLFSVFPCDAGGTRAALRHHAVCRQPAPAADFAEDARGAGVKARKRVKTANHEKSIIS